VNRFAAYSVIVLAHLVGGGSLILFGAFLLGGSFTIIRFDFSETQVLLWDGMLSMLFFIQHSGMIRPSFHVPRWFAMPLHYRPAIYAITSGVVLTAVVLLWQTSPTVLFEIRGTLQLLLRTTFVLAMVGMMWCVWALRPFDLFGQTPIAHSLRGIEHPTPQFAVRGPYLWMRHPLYFFTLVLIWTSPGETTDRWLFNVLWSGWIVVGAYLEERDLVAEFGERYRRYQKVVPMLLPWRGPVGRGM
jgi:protein-S-isoprenylcysteine O-methyltransferase Ste14